MDRTRMGLRGMGFGLLAALFVAQGALGCRGGSGTLFTKRWDGKAPLSCGFEQKVVAEDCVVDLPGKVAVSASNQCEVTLVRCRIRAQMAINAAHDAKIRLVGCDVDATTAISAAHQVQVVIDGGRLAGSERALHLWHRARVDVRNGATVTGTITRYHQAKVFGIPAVEREQVVEGYKHRFGPQACRLAFDCYRKQDAMFGQISGRLALELDSGGTVTAAKYDKGEAPPSVRACFEQLVGTTKLEGYDAGKGRVECSWAGTVVGNSSEMFQDFAFVPASQPS